MTDARKASGSAQNIPTGRERMVAEVVKLTKPVMALVVFEAKRRDREVPFILREWILEQALVLEAKLAAEVKAAGKKSLVVEPAPGVHSPATKTKDVLVSKVVKLPRAVLNLATFEAQRRDRSRAFVIREWVTMQADLVREEIERERAQERAEKPSATAAAPTKRVSKRG